MIVIKEPGAMPIRKFTCGCCGCEYYAEAVEAQKKDGIWKTICPNCKNECTASESDTPSEEGIRAVRKEQKSRLEAAYRAAGISGADRAAY